MQVPREIHCAQSTTNTAGLSELYSEKDFLDAFLQDLRSAASSLVIVSPFITNDATWKVANELKELKAKGVHIRVFTRPLEEHQNRYGFNLAYGRLQRIGVDVKLVSKLHHKLAVIDDSVCWKGTINILGFRDSREQMRRFQGLAAQPFVSEFNLTEPF
jgi:phosphatidylserine/phosphatidylglycerophosphate/cardiolipin synthase-like enzyme